MKPIYDLLDWVKQLVRGWISQIAKPLNSFTGGRLSPNAITYTSFVMHVPIALLIAQERYVLAAGLLVFFGLFDALDGALARLQHSESKQGMLLDSITDRAKEVILYCGVAYSFVLTNQAILTVWAVAACGFSLLVSYINAWSEAVVTNQPKEVNQNFRGGVARYEVRMFLLVVGLLSGYLHVAVIVIAVLSVFTAIERFIMVQKRVL